MRKLTRLFFVHAGLALVALVSATARADQPAETASAAPADTQPTNTPPANTAPLADTSLNFERDIRPIFRAHCFDCHGANDEKKANLDLRQVRLQLKGGESGVAIVPGKPDESFLVERIRLGEMPPTDGKVTPKELETITRWIAEGAKTAKPEPENIAPGLGISDEERAWWSFQPIHNVSIPDAPAGEPTHTPIDALLRAQMPAGLTFSPEVDKTTLLKRAYFDLIGLPPKPAEVDQFIADTAPDAYERALDRLLAMPQYGERWARHWLDAAGYADSEGATAQDAPRAWAYKYRDYVIRSLNADKPFDRFILEQLAGDELAGPINGDLTPEQIELLTATGYLRMAADGTGSGDNSPAARNQVIADTLKIVSSSLLGLTMACAQCHDHRYDPIPQSDYYALRAVFEPALDWQDWKVPGARLVALATAAERAKSAEIEAEVQVVAKERGEKEAAYMTEALEKELTKFEEPLRSQLRDAYRTAGDKRSDAQKQLLASHPSVDISPGVLYQYNQAAADELKKYDAKIGEIRAKKPVEEYLQALVETPEHAVETKLFYRGDHEQPKQTIIPASLSVVAPPDTPHDFPINDDKVPTTGRRMAFARWLTGPGNPLTARVIANRIWGHHFGRGLVETPADFGKLGTLPSHPELLDWLAKDFQDHGWSLKQLHRTIMLTTAYRQSSRRNDAQQALDRDNRFYARKNVVRLDAETLYDRTLATTGELDMTMFGAPTAVQEDDVGQVIVDPAKHRRAIYVMQRRSQPVALMQAFDAPVMQTNCESRVSSTVATQSLMLMNGEFLLAQSKSLAERVKQDAAAMPAEAIAPLLEQLRGAPPVAVNDASATTIASATPEAGAATPAGAGAAAPTPTPETTAPPAAATPDALTTDIRNVTCAWQRTYLRMPSVDELRLTLDYLTAQRQHMASHPESIPAMSTADAQALVNLCHALLNSNEFLYID